jgi:drug/metabolite transporter (DMT)-like permease
VSLPRAPEHPPVPRLGWLLLAAIAIFWGANWVALKVSLAEIPVWQYRATTCLFPGPMLLLIARLGGHRIAIPRAVWGPMLLGALFNITLWQIFSAYGVRLIPSGEASVLAFTMPVWATLLAVVFLGERPTWRILAGLALALCGIAALLSGSFHALGESPLGIALILGAAISWSFGTVVQKRVRWPLAVVAVAGWQLLLGGVPTTILAIASERLRIQDASPAALGALAYSLVLPGVLCQYAWFKVVSLLPASIAAIGTVAVPVVGVIAGAIILGEPLGWRELLALVSVVGALALVLIRPAPRAA